MPVATPHHPPGSNGIEHNGALNKKGSKTKVRERDIF